MQAFYEALGACQPNQGHVALTVVEGPEAGEKALLENGRCLWASDPAGFLMGRAAGLSSFDQAGVVEAEGRRIYREILGGEKKLVICGAGHVAMQVIPLGKMTGFTVTVLEDRASFAENARLRGADRVLCAPFAEGLSRIPGDQDTFFVVVTREHLCDKDCLRAIAGKPCAYVGMMGSRRRVGLVKQDLLAEGYDAAFLNGIHTPIGLGIGARTPEEIAISIMAEIIQVKNENRRDLGFPGDILKALTSKTASAGETARAGGTALPCVLATIIARRGSGPREVGTKMLVTKAALIGTIGGGLVEWDVIKAAREMLDTGARKPRRLLENLMAPSDREAAMVCGGELEILLEVIAD